MLTESRSHLGVTLGLLLGLLVVLPQLAQAQGQIGSKDDCRSLRANPSGTDKEDIVITTGVVVVVAANQGRCSATIANVGDHAVRCESPTDGTPTADAGFFVLPGLVMDLGLASQRGWACTRDTDATGDGLLSVLELFP